MPPCFGSAASAALETVSNDKIAAASACTLRMLSSLEISASDWADFAKTIAWRSVGAKPQGRRAYWEFGLLQRGARYRRACGGCGGNLGLPGGGNVLPDDHR